jgi:hypothetical protein
MLDLNDKILGTSSDRLDCGSSADLHALAIALTRQCRRTLDICGRQLDPVALDHADLYDAVQTLTQRSRYSRIRLLVLQPELLYTRAHHLLRLAHMLPTFVHVRVPGSDHNDFNEAMLIADETGYIHRQLSDRYDGVASFNDRLNARDLTRRFDVIWEHGEIDQNFRRLGI